MTYVQRHKMPMVVQAILQKYSRLLKSPSSPDRCKPIVDYAKEGILAKAQEVRRGR